MKTRFTALILTIVLCLSLAPALAQASTDTAITDETAFIWTETLTKYVQLRLSELEYYIGEADGAANIDTTNALIKFKQDNAMLPTATIDYGVLRALFGFDAVPSVEPTSEPTPEPTPTPFPTLPPTAPQFTSIQQRGASGDSTGYIQIKLSELGYYDGDITARFDDPTRSAVIAFQKNNRLDADGVVGKQTWNKLFYETNYSASETPPPSLTYGWLNYKNVARNPEDYVGDRMKFNGTLLQVMGTRKEGYTLRIATKGSYDDVVYCITVNDPGFALLVDDKVTVYATCEGDYTFETVRGDEITLPYFKIATIELR